MPAFEPRYCISLTAHDGAVAVESVMPLWEGYSEQRNELRAPSSAGNITRIWSALEENWHDITNHEELLRFLRAGGHAIVDKKVIEEWWPAFLDPAECIRYGSWAAYLAVEYLPPGAMNRRPTSATRKLVLSRDGYRCRICGSSPEDHPAIKLDTHHIVEFALGGLIVDSNLITLCKACHEMASPPDSDLRDDFFDEIAWYAGDAHRRRYQSGAFEYRQLISSLINSEDRTPLPDPLNYLQGESFYRIQQMHREAYRELCANSLIRYYEKSTWRRVLPSELKKQRALTNRSS